MSSYGQGGTRQWRRIRQQVLDRDHHECQLRLDVCTHAATEVHHVTSIAARAMLRAQAVDEADACISVCQACHRVVTQRQTAAAQQQAAALRERRKRLPTAPHPGEP